MHVGLICCGLWYCLQKDGMILVFWNPSPGSLHRIMNEFGEDFAFWGSDGHFGKVCLLSIIIIWIYVIQSRDEGLRFVGMSTLDSPSTFLEGWGNTTPTMNDCCVSSGFVGYHNDLQHSKARCELRTQWGQHSRGTWENSSKLYLAQTQYNNNRDFP